MFYIQHDPSNSLVAKGSLGEHSHSLTMRCKDALTFETWSAASDASQNYGPDFSIHEEG